MVLIVIAISRIRNIKQQYMSDLNVFSIKVTGMAYKF